MKKSNKNHNQSKMPPITLVNKALEELGAKTINGKDKQYKQRLESISKSLLIGAHQTKEIIQSMLVKGVSINNVFEEYIPDVARLLGDYWVKSMLSFAQVTLATSRLQSIARELEPLYLGERHPQNLQTEVLIIAPKGE